MSASRIDSTEGTSALHTRSKVYLKGSYICVSLFGALIGILFLDAILNPEILRSNRLVLSDQVAFSYGKVSFGSNQQYEGLSIGQAERLLRSSIVYRQNEPCKPYESDEALPNRYDLREQFSSCLQPIIHRKICPVACTMSTVSVLEFGSCRKSGQSPTKSLSEKLQTTCFPEGMDCGVDSIDSLFKFIYDLASAEEMCISDLSEGEDCTHEIINLVNRIKGTCYYQGEASIKAGIVNNGPVIVIIPIYTDFLAYKSGVYRRNYSSTRLKTELSVELIGWGTDEETKEKYWLVKNSWGTSWGDSGYGRIKFGELGIGALGFALSEWGEDFD